MHRHTHAHTRTHTHAHTHTHTPSPSHRFLDDLNNILKPGGMVLHHVWAKQEVRVRVMVRVRAKDRFWVRVRAKVKARAWCCTVYGPSTMCRTICSID